MKVHSQVKDCEFDTSYREHPLDLAEKICTWHACFEKATYENEESLSGKWCTLYTLLLSIKKKVIMACKRHSHEKWTTPKLTG